MQEDVERRTVAVSVAATRLTAKVLAKALLAVLRKIQKEHRKAQTPQGRQSVKKLMNHGVSTNSLPLDGETKLFDRVARKYNVDYAFHKNGPGEISVVLQGGAGRRDHRLLLRIYQVSHGQGEKQAAPDPRTAQKVWGTGAVKAARA